jgi:hypothetical protein
MGASPNLGSQSEAFLTAHSSQPQGGGNDPHANSAFSQC